MKRRAWMRVISRAGAALLAGPAWAQATGAGRVGVAMPSISSPRWWRDGVSLRRHLIALGWEVDLQVAFDGTAQPQQIEKMLQAGARALVVGDDGQADLSPVLAQAAQRGVPVVAFDRLPRNAPSLAAYVTFDNLKVGQLQGRHIVSQLRLGQGGRGTAELFAGAPEDGNSRFFFQGAWDVLQPHVAAGQLSIGSGVADFDSVAMAGWDADIGVRRLEQLMQTLYQRQPLDALLVPNDTTAIALIKAMERAGWGQAGRRWPVVTGQDASLHSVQAVLAGRQSCTVFKDTGQLAQSAAKTVDDLLRGRPIQARDLSTYRSGGKAVATLLLEPQLLTRANAREVLLSSGYYRADQL